MTQGAPTTEQPPGHGDSRRNGEAAWLDTHTHLRRRRLRESMDEATFTIEDPDGNTDDVTLPVGLVDLFAEEGDESNAQVVGDIALMAFAQRAHAVVHHSEEQVDDELEAIEQAALDQFEERFGQTFGEATGHQH